MTTDNETPRNPLMAALQRLLVPAETDAPTTDRPTPGTPSVATLIDMDESQRVRIMPPTADFVDELPAESFTAETLPAPGGVIGAGVAPAGTIRQMPAGSTTAIARRYTFTAAAGGGALMIAPAYNGPRSVKVVVSGVGNAILHARRPSSFDVATPDLDGYLMPTTTRETIYSSTELWIAVDAATVVISVLIDYTTALPVLEVRPPAPERSSSSSRSSSAPCGCK